MQLKKLPCSSDFEAGAERLHDLLDGKIRLPDKVGVLIVGLFGALIPYGLLLLWYRGTI